MSNFQSSQLYGLGTPLTSSSLLIAERKERNPNTQDINFPIGKLWVNTNTDAIYALTSLSTSAGSTTANWVLLGTSGGDVDTLTGDSGTATPSSNNIQIAGGTNVTTAAAGAIVTVNLDAAISLATSVTSPIYTTSAADMNINSASGQDIIIQMGDNAAANKVSFEDVDSAEVASIDSNGAATFAGLLTGSASATINTAGTALTLAADNSADAVILGGGTSARSITIGQDAAAHTVAIGQAAAGAITIDTAAGVSIDAATASNFSLSGAGADLTLSSAAGRVIVNGEEAAANAITLLSAAGGIDADAALQINIASSQAAADAIRINASDAAGGIDVDDGGGGMAFDSLGAISLDAAAASNFSVSGASVDLTLASAGGSVNITAAEAAADAIVISATDAAGGITIDAGSGGVNLTGADFDVQGGDIKISGAAQQLQVEGGAATDFIGTATLSSGTVTINNTNIAATDRILITRRDINGSTALGQITYSISAATSFTITAVQAGTPASTETNDASIVDYFIVRQL